MSAFGCRDAGPSVGRNTESHFAAWLLGSSVLLQFVIVAMVLWLSHRFNFYSNGSDRPLALMIGLWLLQFCLQLVSLVVCLSRPPFKHLFAFVIGVSVLFRGMLLFSTPIQEVDVYRYMWDGVVATQGISPFRFAPQEILQADVSQAGDALLRLTSLIESDSGIRETLHRVHFPELPTVYPPTSQSVFTIASWLTPANASVELRLRVMKSTILLFDLGTVLLLWRVLVVRQMHPAWTISYAWSPLVLKEFANSGHLDAITVCLTLASVLWLLPPRGRRLSIAHVLVSSVLAGLAVGGKLYPILLFPLIIVYLLRQYDFRRALLWSVGATLSTALALAPMLTATQTIQTGDPSIGPSIQATSPQGTSADTNASRLSGLSTFLTRWEMNDLLFMIVEENLRPANTVASQPPLWFVIVPNKTRIVLNEFVATRIGLDGERVPFLLARFVTLSVFVLIGLWLCRLIWLNPSRLLEGCFLCLAWFWLLAPTQNPWYWTWALCLLPFARNPAWLAVSGFSLLYYFRFWLLYHFPDAPILGSAYRGVAFFDYVGTWIEFIPVYAMLLLTRLRWTDSGPPEPLLSCQTVDPKNFQET